MINPAPLSVEDINAVLLNHNPFSQPPFVNANNVWGKSFPDVESLNSHASDAVFKALEEIRLRRYPTASILITAQNGTGKTHIISRIRHRLQTQGGALFIFANKFNDINYAKQGFQQLLADSLGNIGSQGVKQWQELAASMANEVFKAKNPNFQFQEAKSLVKKIEKSDDQQVLRWITELTKSFCRIKSVRDPDVVRAIFWTLSDDEVSYASNWLAGKELAQFKSTSLRLPNQNQSFDTVLQVLDLISEYYELVICFDELDIPEVNDAGLYKSQIVAGLVKELFENLKRGVILSVMMPGIWSDTIQKQLPPSVSSKMATFCPPLDLKYLDDESTIEVVSFFLKEYYEAREINPPHHVYPFDESQLRSIGQGKPTVRELLQWCRDNCKPPTELPEQATKSDPVELAFTSELSEDIRGQLDNNFFLSDALFFGFETLIGQTLEEVTLESVTTGVGKRGGKDSYLNFKILGKEKGTKVSIGVAVLQYDGGKALGAGLKRLLDERDQFSLTRGCLVRSKEKPINSYFKSTYLNPLVDMGGEFVELREEEVKPLVALRAVYLKRESEYKVTEEEIRKFIYEKGAQYSLGIYNPLLKEILSDPSYQLPDDIEDEPVLIVNSDIDVSEPEDFQELMIHA